MTAESFKTHPIFEKLEQFKQAFSTENINEKMGHENTAFFETAYLLIKDRLKLTLPILVQEAELTGLTAEVEAGTMQINTFIGNNNIGLIQNAVNSITSAINRARNLPMLLTKGDFDFSKAVATFQESIESAYRNIEASNKKLQVELNATQEDLASKNAQIATLQQQLATKETEIQNFLTKYEADFEVIKTNNNAAIESEKKKFNESLEADRKVYKADFEVDKETNKKDFEGQKEKFEKSATEIIGNLNTKLSEANKIVNIVGNVGVTGNYQKIANENKKTANFFRWIALGFMVTMSGLLIWSIIDLSTGEFNLYKSLVRILAAAVLTYPAVYAARESAKHRKLETQNRNLELELASIGPFIELLPEDKKENIKEELVKKYFGNHIQTSESKEEEDVSINALEKILKAILPFIKK